MGHDLNDEELKATRDSNGANICVGDYVRTKAGKIDKVINDDYYMSLYIECHKGLVEIENIVKHSKDIIDLIEEGDYVNGERILDITGDYIHTNETVHNKFYLAKHIKSIVTKEQFNSIAYRLEE